MNKSLVLLAVAAALSGCNGGGGGSSESSSSGSTPGTYEKDGIYLNNTDLVVMLIDTEQQDSAMVVGDYVNNDFYANDTHTVNGNTMTNKGLTYASNYSYLYNSTIQTTVTFSSGGATVSGVVNNQNMMYSFERTGASAALSEITGTHTNPDDGSTWTINSDGSFIVNGVCTFSGSLSRVKDYYLAKNVSATGCDSTAYNATDYEARVITVNHAGTIYILGIMANDKAVLWGSTPV